MVGHGLELDTLNKWMIVNMPKRFLFLPLFFSPPPCTPFFVRLTLSHDQHWLWLANLHL